ncbi:hypothetical protein GCM10027321_36490 [Massilia terrae]
MASSIRSASGRKPPVADAMYKVRSELLQVKLVVNADKRGGKRFLSLPASPVRIIDVVREQVELFRQGKR